MLEFDVNSGAELRAAVMAASQATYDEARKHPVVIRYGRATYTFPNGLHHSRAERISAEINKQRVK